MQAHGILRIGRFGPVIVHLHFTWILVSVLGLWWFALLWAPQNFPGWTVPIYWFLAVATMLLYVASAVLHEVVHGLVGGGKRGVVVYPFGAGIPFRTRDLQNAPGRALLAALAGPAFNLILGGLLLVMSDRLGVSPEGAPDIRALIIPLAWINVAFGALNLVPAIPFDGGWALAAVVCWFSGDREGGVRLGRTLGSLATLGLALFGAWRGLVNQSWFDALILIVIAWAGREALELGRQRDLLHATFEELKARDFMDPVKAADLVHSGDSMAQMVKSHPHYPPDLPLPVVDSQNHLEGVITLASADSLLQGTWPSTPVTAVMERPGAGAAVLPGTPLDDLVALIESRPGDASEQTAIPVLEDDQLVGSVDPSKLGAFQRVDLEFGVGEKSEEESREEGFGAFARRAVPGTILLAALAVLASIALHTNPYEARGLGYSGSNDPISFRDLVPVAGAVVPLGEVVISANIVGARAITSATLSLDGTPLEITLAGPSPVRRSVSVVVPELPAGKHVVDLLAVGVGGDLERTRWEFTAGPVDGAQASPTTVALPEGPRVTRYAPSVGGMVLAGKDGASVAVRFQSEQQPGGARLAVDGQVIDAAVAPVEGAQRQYIVSGSAPLLEAGTHNASAMIEVGAQVYSFDWTFSAALPDSDNSYFEATGHFVGQPFLKYWQENGGLALFGYPISDRIRETDKASGKTYVAQYFERARFELHPETGDTVVLGRLGAITTQPEAAAAPVAGAQFFAETGHNLAGQFLAYWQEHGGLPVFGYPITEERTETSPLDGKEYKVQYFERARFELHPEFAGTPNEVQLGQLGRELYTAQYGK